MESITILSNNATSQSATALPANNVLLNRSSEETCEMKNMNCEIMSISRSGNPKSEVTGSKTVSAATLSSQSGSWGLPLSTCSSVFVAGQPYQHHSPMQSVDNSQRSGHVVTIRINPDNNIYQSKDNTATSEHNKENQHHSVAYNSENNKCRSDNNTRVSLNQSSPINTIGKFIVNICESSAEDGYQLSNITSHNNADKSTNGCVRITLGTSNTLKDNNQDSVEKLETMKTATNGSMNNPYFYYSSFPYAQNNLVPSGQCSPSDTLDSGTCSDLDGTPPPLPKKKLSKTNGKGHKLVSVTVIGSTAHDRTPSLISSAEADSEDSESNISCDSLNSSELSAASLHEDANTFKSELIKSAIIKSEIRKNDIASQNSTIPKAPKMPVFVNSATSNGFLPHGLLQDIRERSAKLSSVNIEETLNKTQWNNERDKKLMNGDEEKLTSFKLVSQVNNENKKPRITDVLFSQSINNEINNSVTKTTSIVNESTYEDRKLEQEKQKHEQVLNGKYVYDADQYYDFHLNENVFDNDSDTDKKTKKKLVNGKKSACDNSDSEFYDEESMEYFAGVKDYKTEDGPATIKSAKGTIRGVKNRVRAGIATFLQMQNSTAKNYKEKDAGKVVLYSTSMGIVRGTYQKCVLVKKILRNLLIKYEERDVFMSGEYQEEIKDRMRCSDVLVPQLFIDGQHIGDAETVERLNESGDLRRMLKPYKSADACTTCQVCGGYRLLPCQVCSGSKKSVHRNHFTTEFVALKCMNCDEVGLVKCYAC